MKVKNPDKLPLEKIEDLIATQGDGKNTLKDLNEENYAKLKASIDKHGFIDPIAIWRDGDKSYIIDGHQRKRVIAREWPGAKVPVRQIPADSMAEAAEILLKITSQFGRLTQEGLDWFIATYDLPEAEISQAVTFDALPMLGDDDEPDVEEDEAPEVNENDPPISQPGEIYQLGRHRLMCGDSTKAEDVEKLMDGQLANLVNTDPPYMVDYHSPAGLTYKSKKFGGDGGAIFNDDLDESDALRFFEDSLKNLYDFTTADCPIYWYYASRNQHLNRMAFINAGWYVSQTIIWVKESMIFSIGQDYHRMYEPIMYGWKKGEAHFTNKRIADLKDAFTLSPSDFAGLLDVWLERRDNTSQYEHPTQKPVSLASRAIRKSSKPGDNVLDLFAGAGFTLMAAEQMGRNAFLMELDPKYCDVIRKRFHKFHNEDKTDGWEDATAPINTTKEVKNA